MISNTLTSRIKACFYHFLISLLIFSLFIAILLIYWYPEPYFTASGGWQGLKIVAFVDLVLGPLLTFTAFNHLKPKKTLRNDMLIIVFLQLSALAWGINTVYNQRPIAIVFWESQFYTIPYNEIASAYENNTKFQAILKNTRAFYYVSRPITVSEMNDLAHDVKVMQLPPFQLINRYETIGHNFQHIKNQSIDINEVINNNHKMKTELTTLLKNTKTTLNNNVYISLISRYQNIILVFSNDSELLGFIKAPLKIN